MSLNKSKLNSFNAYTDQVSYDKEYRDNHKEEKREYDKEYHQKHKQEHKERVKEYYQNHKEKINEQKRNNYYNNQDKIKAQTSCPCGGKYQHKRKAEHFKTKLHLDYLSGISVEEDFPTVDPLEISA